MAKKKDIEVTLPTFKIEPILIKAGINTDWSHDFYKIVDLHKKGYKGKGVKIAVLDTGIELTNDAFTKAIAENRITALDARAGKNDPIDYQGHGTWCCSRYIADDDEILGFAPECEIISIKVLNDNGSGFMSDVVTGYKLAMEHGAHIISTSLGSPGSMKALQDVVIEAHNRGIVLLSAAGNDGTKENIDYPAMYAEVFAIGSHDEGGKRATHSDWGVDSDLYASGIRVKGAWSQNRVTYAAGTSMATPSIGGIIALLYSTITKNNNVINREFLKNIATCL